MKSLCRTASWVIAAIICRGAAAQAVAPTPAFDVAYRAWEVVTDISRHNRDQAISGECGKTFRPFVIPGLRRQTKQEEDLAAAACYETARSVCANARLQRTAEMARKCEEFK